MKYLKHFESENNTDHIQIVLDVFQDLIDDWDLEVLNGESWSLSPGSYFRIDSQFSIIGVKIFQCDSKGINNLYQSELNKEILEHLDRLNRMGYGTSLTVFRSFINIVIEIIDI